ncbi:MAG: hypothetical protein CMJ59_21780 [Planctomycetaceae bacterium]|nr:hypothetical protein [Planctomycetaceae bacterium]
MAQYQQSVQRQRDWQVDLACSECNRGGLPKYDGRTPGPVLQFGQTPTIDANAASSLGGRGLIEAEGDTLQQRFNDGLIPPRSKRVPPSHP